MANDNIEIRPRFRDLIPRLAKHELDKLEASIMTEGIRDPLTVGTFASEKKDGTAPRVLIDGHHRHEIATKHGLPIPTREIEFEDEDAAIIWAIDTQIGRRNILHVLDRVILLEKKRPILEAQAQARQLAGKGEDLAGKVPQGASKKRHPTVTEQLAAELKISRNLYDDCLLIIAKGIPALLKFVREGKMSVTGAAKLLHHVPHGRASITDDEHQKWQQELVDNVRGDPDAMQAVVRNINRDKRQYERMREQDAREAAEAKKREEHNRAGEKRDAEEIAKWREEERESNEVTPEEEEQEVAVVEEEEREEEEQTEQTATVTEFPRRNDRQEAMAKLVSAIVDAVQGVLDARGLGMSADGQEALAGLLEVWVIDHSVEYQIVRHAAGEEIVS